MKRILVNSFIVLFIAAASVHTASADIYTWVGGSNKNFHRGDNWTPVISYSTDWKSGASNIMKFSDEYETADTYKTIDVGFNLTAAGVIVESSADGYSVYTPDDALTVTFYATSDADAAADARLTAGVSNFIIDSDFSFGDRTSNANTFDGITFTVDANIVLAKDVTFTMKSETLTTGTNTVTTSGEGTYALNVTEDGGMDTSGTWKVGGDSTLLLQNNAGTILTTSNSSTVILDGGTISLESGSIILQTIEVTDNGGGLAVYTTDVDGSSTLTLNGTISASSLSDISLDLTGVNLVLGKDFVIELDYDLTADEVSVFQNLASFSNENYYIAITVGGVAVDKVYFSYDANGTLSVVPEPTTTSLSLLALAGLLLRRRRKA